MDYRKVDPRAVKSWRIGRAIRLCVLLIMAVPAEIYLARAQWFFPGRAAAMAAVALLVLYGIVTLILYPAIEYRQWGYIVEEDKVVIRHGIFFVREAIIPVIRIQNITVTQGPINRRLGLYEVELSLASGSFSIDGLDRETADAISENLKEKLYQRVAARGVLS